MDNGAANSHKLIEDVSVSHELVSNLGGIRNAVPLVEGDWVAMNETLRPPSVPNIRDPTVEGVGHHRGFCQRVESMMTLVK